MVVWLLYHAFLLIAAIPFIYYVIAIYSTWRFFRVSSKQNATAPSFTPPVSILKPVRGLDPDAYENFASFCQQDYPEYEIVFCVGDGTDPVLPVIEKVVSDFPECKIRVLFGSGRVATNDKVAKLARLVNAARYEYLVINDSDVRAEAGYLRTIVAPLADPKVGAVTCFYAPTDEKTLVQHLQSVGMLSDFYAGILVAWQLDGVKFALGPTMVTRRARVEEMGGFESMAEYCADDFVLGNETAKLGQTVVLSHHPIDHIVINSNLLDSLKHQARWMRSTRFSRPAGHFATSLSFSVPFGLLGWGAAAALGHPWWGVGLFGWSVATRLALAIAVGGMVVQDRSWFDLVVLYPVRDLMGFWFWGASYWSNRVLWRGRVYELLPGGKMRAAE